MTTPNSHVPRVVATDLDGTLLDSAGAVTPRTRAALEAAWEAGIVTVFVTARPPRWLDALADVVGGHGVAICANGAFRYDVAARRVTHVDGFAPGAVAALARDLRAALPGIGFAAERADGFHVEPGYAEVHPPPADTVRAPIAQVGPDVGKLLARCPEVSDARFLDRVTRVVGDRGIVAFSGAIGLAEIGPPGVTKAATLARWCTELGVEPGEVWAFGDMPNDIPMLAWAGRSFAVANAHPEAVAVADARCGGNDEDGVARVLEDLVAGRATGAGGPA